MSNRVKIFQGLMIAVILIGTLGAVAYLAPAAGVSLAHPALSAPTGDVRLTAGQEPVMVASVAWNRWIRINPRSVAWNSVHKG